MPPLLPTPTTALGGQGASPLNDTPGVGPTGIYNESVQQQTEVRRARFEHAGHGVRPAEYVHNVPAHAQHLCI